jgi:hypothetical protein
MGNSRSTVAVAPVAGLLIGAAATYAFAGRGLSRTTTVTSTSTISVTMDSTQQVSSAFAIHLKGITSENLTALSSGYEDNATVEVFGSLIGPLIRPDNVSTFYHVFQSRFSTVNFNNLTASAAVSGSGMGAVANSTFAMYGNATYGDPFSGKLVNGVYATTVSLGVSLVRLGGNWLVSNESWEFIIMDFCPTLSSPNCGALLVHPQG